MCDPSTSATHLATWHWFRVPFATHEKPPKSPSTNHKLHKSQWQHPTKCWEKRLQNCRTTKAMKKPMKQRLCWTAGRTLASCPPMGTKAMDKSGSVGAGKAAGAAEGWPTSNEGKSGKGKTEKKGKSRVRIPFPLDRIWHSVVFDYYVYSTCLYNFVMLYHCIPVINNYSGCIYSCCAQTHRLKTGERLQSALGSSAASLVSASGPASKKQWYEAL